MKFGKKKKKNSVSYKKSDPDTCEGTTPVNDGYLKFLPCAGPEWECQDSFL